MSKTKKIVVAFMAVMLMVLAALLTAKAVNALPLWALYVLFGALVTGLFFNFYKHLGAAQ